MGERGPGHTGDGEEQTEDGGERRAHGATTHAAVPEVRACGYGVNSRWTTLSSPIAAEYPVVVNVSVP